MADTKIPSVVKKAKKDLEQIKKELETIGGIDVDAAAEEAVSTDGPENFLARYDGTINDGPGDIIYWRDN